MLIALKKAFISNVFLKVMALILGYLLWTLFGETLPTTRWLRVPLCFYNTEQTTHIQAPETMWVQLRGKRAHIQHIDPQSLAIHIDAHTFKPGPNGCDITAEHLFLPPALALQDYIPHNIVVTLS